jgi:hypothetical protein
VQKYALSFNEEKAEKKILQEKYDKLEQKFIDKVESISSIKSKFALRMAFILAIALTGIFVSILLYLNILSN